MSRKAKTVTVRGPAAQMLREAHARIAELEAQVTSTADKALSSHDVAKLLRANATSVNKWAEAGQLPHYKTPGGHRRFNAADVADFCKRYGMPVPASLVQP